MKNTMNTRIQAPDLGSIGAGQARLTRAARAPGALDIAAGRVAIGLLSASASMLGWTVRLREAFAPAPGLGGGRTTFGSCRAAPSVGPGAVSPLRIAVGIATVGRPSVACEAISQLARQTRRPDRVVVSAPTGADCPWQPEIGTALNGVTIVLGARGLTAQRNRILDVLFDADIVCFFDDDFVAHEAYLAEIEAAFLADPGLVGATGRVVADGITGVGYTGEQAETLLRGLEEDRPTGSRPTYSAYGCNMAFRLEPMRSHGIRFDEQLPAYGWLEDVDFSRRMAGHGRLARLDAAVGVHLGVKGGRVSGRRFGYSQIANPIYLVRKGSYSGGRALWLMGRNVAKNLRHAYRPEPDIDRRGRLAGNLRALLDLFAGRLHPTRIAAPE